jgi:uncharacterized protein
MSGLVAPSSSIAASAPTDCRGCGACCFSASPTFVRVTGDDWDRLGGDAETFAHFVEHRAFMRMDGGHCAALRIGPESSSASDFFCTIYERRPQICRDLARGSPQCDAEIALKNTGVATKTALMSWRPPMHTATLPLPTAHSALPTL